MKTRKISELPVKSFNGENVTGIVFAQINPKYELQQVPIESIVKYLKDNIEQGGEMEVTVNPDFSMTVKKV